MRSLNPWDADTQYLALLRMKRLVPLCQKCRKPLRLYTVTSARSAARGAVQVEGHCGVRSHQTEVFYVPVEELSADQPA